MSSYGGQKGPALNIAIKAIISRRQRYKFVLNSTNILPCKMITRTDPVIYGEDGPNYLAVLIANKLTAKS